jgi:hypothetical protein
LPKSGALMCLFKSYYYHLINIVAQNYVGSLTLASVLNNCRAPEWAPNVLVRIRKGLILETVGIFNTNLSQEIINNMFMI